MNKYELAVVISAAMDEEAIKAELESIKDMITKLGGTIDKVDEWGKRRLAYEINKTNEGYYTFISFDSQADTPNEVEKRMRIKENVLRYLVVRQDA